MRGFDVFMKALGDLVAGRYDGALKGEHCTGRNMAPFLELEWGPEALGVMRRLKELVDPEGLLNPGVLINDDPRAHITHLKSLSRSRRWSTRASSAGSANGCVRAVTSRGRRARGSSCAGR